MAREKKRSATAADNLHMLIVEARFYDAISDELLRGAIRVLDKAGARYDRVTVPGALEIPAAVALRFFFLAIISVLGNRRRSKRPMPEQGAAAWLHVCISISRAA